MSVLFEVDCVGVVVQVFEVLVRLCFGNGDSGCDFRFVVCINFGISGISCVNLGRLVMFFSGRLGRMFFRWVLLFSVREIWVCRIFLFRCLVNCRDISF